jgi:ABC-type branched-subunit amino acid transport system ATPase component
MSPVLETRALNKRFGGIVATHDVSIALARGARQALIGPNGAGKTTLVNLLTGMLEPTSGSVLLEGQDVTRLAAHERVRRGLVRTFQINQLFDTLTPLSTLTLAIAQREGRGLALFAPLARQRAFADEAAGLAAQLHLADVIDRRVSLLPYGKRRLLEIAIALASRPRVLLLDEPMAGVPGGESREILDTLAALPDDVSVLLIEHDMDIVFRFATRILVLVNGAVLAEGPADAIARDPRVKAVYLGAGIDG